MSPTPVHVVVLTGAGISADSGVATFRDAGGLWEGHSVEEVATPQGWFADPQLVWRFYQERRAGLATVEPNPAHEALVGLEEALEQAGGAFTLITQNVDNLHERAGSKNLLHMHGTLAALACEMCGARIEDLERTDAREFLPCEACGNPRLRPDVVWFGEMPRFLDEIGAALSTCTHFLSIGTSGVVYPAAGLLAEARAVGAKTIVNSLDPPENLDPRDEFRGGRAAEIVPSLAQGLIAEL